MEIIFLFLFFIQLANASEINFSYPQNVNFGQVFDISLELINFSFGKYDVKIDILNPENERIAKILNYGEWKSTYNYVIGIINTSVSNSSSFSLNITSAYNGSAVINISIRKTSTSSISKFGPYSLSVFYQNNSQPENDSKPSESELPPEIPETEEKPCSGYNYSVFDVPSELRENFIIKVKIDNCENIQKFSLWSYVYSGSLCYSLGGREANKINVTVSEKSSATFELNNKVNLSGIDYDKNYKLKVKILREGLKTPKEFTFNLSLPYIPKINTEEKTVENKSFDFESTDSIKLNTTDNPMQEIENKTQRIYYTSKSAEISRKAVYMFAGLMALTCIYLFLKRNNI